MCQYINSEGEEALKKYKYKGGSDSLLYGLLWSPLSEFIVEEIQYNQKVNKIIPAWVAPNLITITGFILVCISASIIQLHSLDYKTDLPSSALFFASLSILIYQILDNVDGKQARKTGSSSPLGMLFDHGCDTTMTWIITMMVANAMQLGNSNIFLFSILWNAFLTFFFAMWTQYHTGQMRLSEINAVDEGLVVVELLFLVTAIFGQGFWSQTVPFAGIPLNTMVVLSISVVALFQSLNFIRMVGSDTSFYTVISTLGLPATISTVFLVTAVYSPLQVTEFAYLYVYAFGFIWSKMVGQLQVAHVTDQKITQWNITWIGMCLVQIINVIILYNGYTLMDQKTFAYLLMTYGLIIYLYFCISVSNQMARVLKINVFKLQKIKTRSYGSCDDLPNSHSLKEDIQEEETKEVN